MTSGQMWNHIRGPPFMHKNPQTGQVVRWLIFCSVTYVNKNKNSEMYHCWATISPVFLAALLLAASGAHSIGD